MNTNANCCKKCTDMKWVQPPAGGAGSSTTGMVGIRVCSDSVCECHIAKTATAPDWEKEFDEIAEQWKEWSISKLAIKDFITNLLTQSRLQYRQELVGKVEAMRINIPTKMIHLQTEITRKNRIIARKKAEEHNHVVDSVLALLKD